MDTLRLRLLDASYQPPLVTVAPNTPVVEAIHLMSQAHTSCVLVLEQQKLVNIFTERDVVRAIANKINFAEMTIAELMLQPVITLSETDIEDLNTVLQLLCQHHISHLPMIDGQGQVLGVVTGSNGELLGIITQSSILQALDPIELCEVITVLQQIIDTKKAEVALRESEERGKLATQYRLLFATNPNPMWIFDLETLRFLAVNQAAILNYGYSESEFLSMTLADIRPPEQISYLQTTISNFKRSSSPMFVCEAKHFKRDGTIIDVEINSHRITWEDKAAGFALIKDITAEKTALRDRQQNQALLEEAQQVARLGNWEYNLETGKINWSKQLFNLYNRDPAQLEPKYQELLQLFHPEDAEKLTQAVERAVSTGESYKLLLRVIKTDKSIMYVEAIGHAEFNADGKIVRLYGTTQDITERIHVEEKLRYSEAQLVNSQKIAHVGSWGLDFNTYQRSWSKETFHIFGLDPHQVEPNHAEFLQMVHPEDRAAVQTQLRQTIAYNTPFCWEYRIIRPDGSIRYVESRAEVAQDNQGNIAQLFGAILDITERKQTELEIIHSRDLREAIFNESADALFLVDPETFLTTDCNQQALKMFGVSSKGELLGIDVYAFHQQPFPPEEIAACVQQFIQLGFWSREIEYVSKQGNVFWGNIVMKRIRVAGQDMNLVRITDISEQQAALQKRQQAEAALARSEEQLRLTLEFTHIGTWDWNVKTGEVVWNDNHYRLLGLDPAISTAQYHIWRNAVDPEDIERVEQLISQALGEHTNFEAEYRVIHPDGNMHWLTGRARGIYNAVGEPIRMLGIIINISDRKFAEAKLEASEARFQEIAHTISQLFFVRSAITGEFIYVSPAYESIWERSCESLYQDPQSWVESIHPDDRPIVTQSLKKPFAGNCVKREYRIVRPNGEVRWIFAQIHLVRNQAGKPLRFIGMAVDISDRKFAEQALQEKETFLRSIYNSVGQAIFVVDVINNDFHYVGLNHTHEILTGLDSNELQGKTPGQILPPNLAATIRQHYQDCLDAGDTITYEDSLPFQGQQTCWITTLTPLKDANSRIYRIVGNSVNISDRKRTEQMLELQAVITRNMAEGICLIRADDGVTVYTNPKFDQMFGYESGELIGQHVSVINYEDDQITAKSVNEVITANIMQHGEFTYEVENIKKDGTCFWSSATSSVFEHPEHGTVFVTVQQDITEQKQAEEKIKASLKEKEVLLKEIHHRVKNNLGIVSSLLQMQYRRTQDSQATAILLDSRNRIASIALVHEKLYRSDDLANINFAQYIPDLTTHLFDSYNVSSSNIQLNIQVEDVSLDIETAIPCGLIINELVSNALKYAFPINCTGKIQVSLSQASNHTLILIIRDNGVGLPAEFESKKTKTLGMNLIQGLVKQLRGTLEINSQQGTEFKISFTAVKA